jgi:pyruvate-ferredoxin/flavodoxin oxidoreductase
MNIQDGFLTSHLERTFLKAESELIRQYLGDVDDTIDCPTQAQRELFGPTRRRVPKVIDLASPIQIGPVQNQEHYMNGVIARRNHFAEPILGFLEDAYEEFGRLTGRHYGVLREYSCEGAETVFLSLGSAAENVEAAVDYIEETRDAQVGSIHINVLRPFPEEAVVRALRGRKRVIILERTDEPLSGDNPLTRDVRTALSKAVERGERGLGGGPSMSAAEVPRIFSGTYGLGSRDFRPEGILGAYEFVVEGAPRKDGHTAADGTSYFTVGIDHPYEVRSSHTPSLLPDGAIAIRLHSIGGWGMITTGKNLGAIIGAFGADLAEDRGERDETGGLSEVLHISANPKYGSEKKGAPTAYFLGVAPERIRVNCDLKHVDVVLCCDPKAFTHTNPIAGIKEGGALVWESDQSPEKAWNQIPPNRRQEIVDKKIRIFTLPGFDIARNATDRADLQLRMQGNAFLGAFFRVSSFLDDYSITEQRFEEVVLNQYNKKFGRFGEAVVASNMQVMRDGFSRISEVPHGDLDAADESEMRGSPLLPASGTSRCGSVPRPAEQPERANIYTLPYFESEFRADLGYDQPASPLSAVGVTASATGATVSKYVARRETPIFIQENCTQCMECISVCPDTALPNTAQDIDEVLATAIGSYVTDPSDRERLIAALPAMQVAVRSGMNEQVAAKGAKAISALVSDELVGIEDVSDGSKGELMAILKRVPLAYAKTNAIFKIPEKKNAGDGGIFSIFVSDLCKGCAACVTACGSHEALKMVPDSEAVNEQVTTQMGFFDLLQETDQKFLGRYDDANPESSKLGVLKNHLMVQRNYEGLLSGDGACAGCGEKTVLRSLATVTEAYMRPVYHKKAVRLDALVGLLESDGVSRLASLQSRAPEEYARFRRAVAHQLMGLGGESEADTDVRLEAHGEIADSEVIEALCAVMRQDAFNHRHLQANDGRLANGMSVMAMGAHTGCNTVFGSTPPNNPHPYPWMNSLFQDGATVGWMFGESFIADHARRSVVPERLGQALMGRDADVITPDEYEDLKVLSDAGMTDLEIKELPKAWIVGGDGGMGDIGFQNVSKVVLQNRPNVKLLMLDTQVYSNTGGQNSDSSPMPGGGDMNGLGLASQGKLVEKKSVAEIMTAGHGSPFVAQVSMANANKLYRALFDGLEYRGVAFFQCFTTCQPEHGVPDDSSQIQAKRIRDARGMPEFIFNPAAGERYTEAMDLKGNPSLKDDWTMKSRVGDRDNKYLYTTAHWATTEARFRRHFKRISAEDAEGLTLIDDMLVRLTQQDVINRRYMDPGHRAYTPDFGVYIAVDETDGKLRHMAISRQVVLFCVERRKAWRMLQSKGGVDNAQYLAQKRILAKVDAGEIALAEFLAGSAAMLEAERASD